jgi:hypothetical protein
VRKFLIFLEKSASKFTLSGITRDQIQQQVLWSHNLSFVAGKTKFLNPKAYTEAFQQNSIGAAFIWKTNTAT